MAAKRGGDRRPAKRVPKRRRSGGPGRALRVRALSGTVRLSPDGSAFLVPDAPDQRDVYLPPEELEDVRDGDVVTVELAVGRKGRVRGRIVARGPAHAGPVVGLVRRMGAMSYLISDAEGPAFVIPAHELRDAKDGEAVVARVIKQGVSPHPSHVAVQKILGRPSDPRVQVEMAVRAQGWPMEFDDHVLAELTELREVSVAAELADGRRDLRGVAHVTIDGEDARDFDDAVGAAPERDGYRVWVSIADVSHYVRPGTAVDRAARERATSVYFPDRVLPMLPEKLSNDLCSLRPSSARLTLTAELHVDPSGHASDVRLYPSIIESQARLTYTQVQRVIDDEAAAPVFGAGARSTHPQRELIGHLTRAARFLRAQRKKRGSLDFDIPEPKVLLDEHGAARDIALRERFEAHRLIEDLMIAANEAVAEHLLERNWPTVFRVHEPPEVKRLEEASRWARKLGLRFDWHKARDPRHLAQLVERLRQHPAGAAVQPLVLRMLSQARYEDGNLGHYGLASRAYLHFTSPIRRYPDLLVHRSLRALWLKQPAMHGLGGLARHCSLQERRAMEAERSVVQLMACQVALEHLGETMEADVVGVHGAGAFVRPRELFVDGLVSMEALSTHHRDYFDLIDDEQLLLARRTGHRVRLGDRLRVKLASVNLRRRHIDFVPEESAPDGAKARPAAGRKYRRGRR